MDTPVSWTHHHRDALRARLLDVTEEWCDCGECHDVRMLRVDELLDVWAEMSRAHA